MANLKGQLGPRNGDVATAKVSQRTFPMPEAHRQTIPFTENPGHRCAREPHKKQCPKPFTLRYGQIMWGVPAMEAKGTPPRGPGGLTGKRGLFKGTPWPPVPTEEKLGGGPVAWRPNPGGKKKHTCPKLTPGSVRGVPSLLCGGGNKRFCTSSKRQTVVMERKTWGRGSRPKDLLTTPMVCLNPVASCSQPIVPPTEPGKRPPGEPEPLKRGRNSLSVVRDAHREKKNLLVVAWTPGGNHPVAGLCWGVS